MVYNKFRYILVKAHRYWQNFNETIQIKTLIYIMILLLLSWYLIIVNNVLNINGISLSNIKSTTLYVFGLRDYNEIYAPTFLWKFGIAMISDKHDEIKNVIYDIKADIIYDIESFNNIRNGDIIWIRDLQLFHFVNKILPNIDKYFTLIIATNIDWIIPLHYNKIYKLNKYNYLYTKENENIFTKLMRNKYLLYVFAENYDTSLDDKYDNIEMMPLGMDFHTAFVGPIQGLSKFGHYDSLSMQEYKIKQLLNGNKMRKLKDRKFKIYVDNSLNIIEKYGYQKYQNWLNTWHNKFGLNWKATNNYTQLINNLYSERDKYRKFWYRSWVQWNINNNIDKENKNLFHIDRNSYNQYLSFLKRSEYVFSLSPFGNGLDCHRTYESLLFGNIIIIQSSPLDKLFKKHDLPVIIINDFKQINQTMLRYWYQKYKNKISLNNPNTRYKLTNHYWMSYIRKSTLQKLQKITAQKL